MGAHSFLLEQNHFQMGDKRNRVTSPLLKVHTSSLTSIKYLKLLVKVLIISLISVVL